MKIYVCVKHVPDTAAKITIIGNNQIDEAVTFIINPYDENAIEAAAGLKKQIGDAEIHTAIRSGHGGGPGASYLLRLQPGQHGYCPGTESGH